MADPVPTPNPNPPQPRRPRRRPYAWLTAGLAIVAAGAVALWSWLRPGPVPPLARDWPAVAVVLAGDGVDGVRNGDAAHARFSDPFGVAIASDGSVYVADAGDAQAIRRIARDGIVSTVAGGLRGYADGPGSTARFDTPSGVAVDASGTVFVADTANNAIRRLGPDGSVSTVAGGGASGFADGTGREARFNGPIGIAIAADGHLIVADTYNHRIRSIRPDGVVSTLAGNGLPGAMDGVTSDAQFDTPAGVAVGADGSVYVADTGNGLVRVVSTSGIVSTVQPLPGDVLLRPAGIAVGAEQRVYVTDDRGRVVEIAPFESARILAGSRPGFADGSDARFRALAGIAVAEPGRLVVADPRNALIRVVAARSKLEWRAPPLPRIDPVFDVARFGREPLLWPLSPMEGPFEVAGTMGEARGGAGSERFHAGIDIHALEGMYVQAVRDGVVSSPVGNGEFGTLNESLRIGAVTYVHMRVGRERDGTVLDPERFAAAYDETGTIVHMRVKRGARFTAGEPIGTVNPFNHVHLNVGWPGEEYNPLRFGPVQFVDRIPPTIARGGIRLFREDGQRIVERRKGRLLVEGPVQIVVDAWDQADGNPRRRRLGVYRLGYQIVNRNGSPAPGFEVPRETIRFDRLAPDDSAPRIVYASGSGIPFYGGRSTRFLYVVTNDLVDGRAAAGTWDAGSLAPGDYILRILAADFNGNVAVANRDLPITIQAQPHAP